MTVKRLAAGLLHEAGKHIAMPAIITDIGSLDGEDGLEEDILNQR